MKRFWEWMKENKYIDDIDEYGGYILGSDGVHATLVRFGFTKEMQIGYMMKYCLEKKISFSFIGSGSLTTNIVYDNLKKNVEE